MTTSDMELLLHGVDPAIAAQVRRRVTDTREAAHPQRRPNADHRSASFWPVRVDEHARDPLPEAAARALALHPDSPDTFSLAVCAADPDAAPTLAHRSRAHAQAALRHHPLPPPEPSRHPDGGDPVAPWHISELTRGAIALSEFVDLAFPAQRLLQAIDAFAPYFPDAAAKARAHLTARADTTLGTDPEAWVIAARILPDFPGTFPELVATAAAAAYQA